MKRWHVPGDHMNCLMDSLRRLLVRQGRSDTVQILAQPLGFGFEIELGSRDWWLGGFSGTHFQMPRYNRGFMAVWEDRSDGLLSDWVMAEITAGRPVLFQTEWMFVPYSPHAGYNLGDIHVATILDVDTDTGRLCIRDRMCTLPDLVAAGGIGWVDAEVFARALERRLRVLRWRFDEAALAWDDEMRLLLHRSVAEMRDPGDAFAPGPHVHINKGLRGIRYFADVVQYCAPQFHRDSHVRMLLGNRLIDSVKTVMGDRILLRSALEGCDLPKSDQVDRGLEHALAGWAGVLEVLAEAAEQDTPDMAAVADRIRAVLPAEEQTVAAIEALLA